MDTDATDPRRSARERVSALLDAELDDHDRDRAFRDLAEDEGLCATWERYHLIGACLRREALTVQPGLASRIAARLAAEPAGSALVASAAGAPSRADRRLVWPLAMAASVAALVGGGLTIQSLWDAPGEPAMVAAATETANVTRWNTADPGHEATLNALLIEHSEFTSPPAMNGLASYAKFVSYDAAR